MSRARASSPQGALAVALAAIAPVAIAQAVLSPAEGAPGSRQTLSFRVADACGGAPRTQEVAIRLPWRFRLLRALPREGWEVGVQQAVDKNGPLGLQGGVSWRAVSAATASAPEASLEFAIEARLPSRAGEAPFTVAQRCADGTRAEELVALRVLPPARAPVRVAGAWARATAPQGGDSALYLVLRADMDLRLVHAHSPRVGRIEVQRTLLGKLRDAQAMPVAPVDLPAGQRVALAPGLASLALQRIDMPLAEGERLPVTLRFEDAAGVVSERVLEVPVHRMPPAHADEGS